MSDILTFSMAFGFPYYVHRHTEACCVCEQQAIFITGPLQTLHSLTVRKSLLCARVLCNAQTILITVGLFWHYIEHGLHWIPAYKSLWCKEDCAMHSCHIDNWALCQHSWQQAGGCKGLASWYFTIGPYLCQVKDLLAHTLLKSPSTILASWYFTVDPKAKDLLVARVEVNSATARTTMTASGTLCLPMRNQEKSRSLICLVTSAVTHNLVVKFPAWLKKS